MGNKIVKLKCHLDTGYVGADHEDIIEIEIPEGISPEEEENIKEEEAKEWVWNLISLTFETL